MTGSARKTGLRTSAQDNSIGLTGDVENDNDIRFQLRLHISGKILNEKMYFDDKKSKNRFLPVKPEMRRRVKKELIFE